MKTGSKVWTTLLPGRPASGVSAARNLERAGDQQVRSLQHPYVHISVQSPELDSWEPSTLLAVPLAWPRRPSSRPALVLVIDRSEQPRLPKHRQQEIHGACFGASEIRQASEIRSASIELLLAAKWYSLKPVDGLESLKNRRCFLSLGTEQISSCLWLIRFRKLYS